MSNEALKQVNRQLDLTLATYHENDLKFHQHKQRFFAECALKVYAEEWDRLEAAVAELKIKIDQLRAEKSALEKT